MKLQNRQNPEIIADLNDHWFFSDNGDNIILRQYEGHTYRYSTLTELYKEWKDYTTLLPVAIRESFKQWAKFNNLEKVRYYTSDKNHSWFSKDNISSFTYDINMNFEYFEEGKEYTVKELVGE